MRLGRRSSDPTSDSSRPRADATPGVPDAFERLWTPHRMVYIDGENKPPTADGRRLPVLHHPEPATTATG